MNFSRGGQLTPFAPMCGRPCYFLRIYLLLSRFGRRWPLVIFHTTASIVLLVNIFVPDETGMCDVRSKTFFCIFEKQNRHFWKFFLISWTSFSFSEFPHLSFLQPTALDELTVILSLECCRLLRCFSTFILLDPTTYCFILTYTCVLPVVIKRICYVMLV